MRCGGSRMRCGGSCMRCGCSCMICGGSLIGCDGSYMNRDVIVIKTKALSTFDIKKRNDLRYYTLLSYFLITRNTTHFVSILLFT
jgi:hypothetical protein